MKKLIISGLILIALIVVMYHTQNSSLNVVRAVGIAFITAWVICIGLIVNHAKSIES